MYSETDRHDDNPIANRANRHVQLNSVGRHFGELQLVTKGLPSYVERQSRGAQRHPHLVSDGVNLLVGWTDDVLPLCEIGGPDIRAKRLSCETGDINPSFKVNTETIDHQRDPSIAVLSGGRVVVAWQDFSGRGGDQWCGAIKAKILDLQSRMHGAEFLVNRTTQGKQSKVALAALSSGGFVAAWQCESGGNVSIRAQSFDEHGDHIGDEMTLCPHAAPVRAKVCALPDGGFAVLYKELGLTGGSARGCVKLFTTRVENGHLFETGIPLVTDASAEGGLGLVELANGLLAAIWVDGSGHKTFGTLMASILEADKGFSKPVVVATECDLRAQISLAKPGGDLLLLAIAETVGDLKTIRIIAFDTALRATRSDTVLHRTHAHCASPAIATVSNADHVVVWEAGETNGREDWIWVKAQRFRYK